MSPQEQRKECAQFAELLVFYVCDEVNGPERAAIEKHLAVCPGCQAQLAQEREFHSALDSLPRPGEQLDAAGILLAQCRSELAEHLDDLARPPAKMKTPLFAGLRGWMTLHPAWSAATLVLFGLAAGVQSTRWFHGSNNMEFAATDQPVNVRFTRQELTKEQLSKMVLAGINFMPSGDSNTKNVRVQMSAEQPMVLTGDLDDSDVRSVLTYVVENGDRFDSGTRLDCLDALKTRAKDAEVRSALMCAARRDQNPAVRLKALEALRGAASDMAVRGALLQALRNDSNPGVRVEAVNLLVLSLDEPETLPASQPAPASEEPGGPVIHSAAAPMDDGSMENVIRALGELQRNDPSRYVRLRSAAALRQISARNEQ